MFWQPKSRSEMTEAERAALDAERARVREQILRDQASNAKRDAKALRSECEWFRKNGGEK